MTQKLTDEEFKRRLESLLREEADNPMAFWFLSYASPLGWRGLIVEARGFTHAVYYAKTVGLSPGGEVMGLMVPEDQIPPPQYQNRLMTKEQFEEFWGTMKTVAQWDKEEKILRHGGHVPDWENKEND